MSIKYLSYTFARFFVYPTAPPRFTSELPSLISIAEGGNLSLTVSVSGNPAPKITWSLQGKAHGEQSGYKITAEMFEINEVRFEDQGMITCRAENLFGVREAGVKLIVFGKFSQQ